MKILNYSKSKKRYFKIYFKCMISYFRKDLLITQLRLLQTNCQIVKKSLTSVKLIFSGKPNFCSFFGKAELIEIIFLGLTSNALSYPCCSPLFHVNIWPCSIPSAKIYVCQVCTKFMYHLFQRQTKSVVQVLLRLNISSFTQNLKIAFNFKVSISFILDVFLTCMFGGGSGVYGGRRKAPWLPVIVLRNTEHRPWGKQ